MKRAPFIKAALRLVGAPYRYGGRFDPPDEGGDCWGAVAAAAKASGGPPEWHRWWTDMGWQHLEPAFVADPGVLAFFGGKGEHDVDHVAVHLGAGLILTTTRGDSTVTTVELARQKRARVTVYTAEEYLALRGDFRGLRKLPFED